MALPPLFLSRKVMRITYESTQQPETAYPARNRLDPYDIPCSLRNRWGEGQSVYSRNPIWYPELYHREPKAHDFDNHESI